MATVFDLGLLQEFQIIFVWLLVFVLVYAILELTKVLGENKGLHAIIALCAAIIFSFSKSAVHVVTGMTPWIVVMLFFFLFLLMGIRFAFGEAGDQYLLSVLGGEKGAAWWIFIPVVIILSVMLMSAVGPALTPTGNNESGSVGDSDMSTDTSDWQRNILNTMFHPKILGTGILLLIAMFTITTICSVPKP